jgi:hypothetical protein
MFRRPELWRLVASLQRLQVPAKAGGDNVVQAPATALQILALVFPDGDCDYSRPDAGLPAGW